MSKKLTCPLCNSTNVETHIQMDEFGFKSHNVEYQVRASVPVRLCRGCGEEYEDEEGENARHEATCHAMRRLAPREITSIRNRLRLTRRQFAELTGIGEASLARWESGELIQSESNDSLLQLVADPHVAQRLAELRHVAIPQLPARHTASANARSSSSVVREPDVGKYQGFKNSNRSSSTLRQQNEAFSLPAQALHS